MNKKILKPLAIGIIVILTVLAFQPAVSTNEFTQEKQNSNKYLFNTIVDITKNPDIKNIFSQINQEEIIYSNNFKTTIIKNLIKKPSLLASVLFSRHTLTNNYLNNLYNKGINTINILGEDKSIEIVSLFKESNSDVINDLTNTILNNEELQEKVIKLKKMNNEIKTDYSFSSNPLICTVFTSLTVFCVIGALIVKDIVKMIPDALLELREIFLNMVSPFIDIALIFASIASVFGCWDDWPGF